MAKKRTNELTAGLFVLLAIGVGLGVIVWLGAAEVFGGGNTVTFYVPAETGDVGLEEGSSVLYAGAVIGRITELEPQPDRKRTLYRAALEIDGVRADAETEVIAAPIGAAKLAITSLGTSQAAPADDENPVSVSGGLAAAMSNLTRAAENIAAVSNTARAQFSEDETALLGKAQRILSLLSSAGEKIDASAGAVRDELKADHTGSLLQKFHVSADHVAGVTAAAANEVDPKRPDSLLGKVHGTVDNLKTQTDPDADGSLVAKVHTSLDDVNAISADARPKVAAMLTSAESAVERVETYTKKDLAELLTTFRDVNTEVLKIARNFGDVSEQAREIVILNRDSIDETIDNMAVVSATLKAAAKEIRRNPWRLLHRPDDEELRSQDIYDAARAFMGGAAQLDQAMSKLKNVSKLCPEGLPADDPRLKKIREHLEKTFENFTEVEKALWKELNR